MKKRYTAFLEYSIYLIIVKKMYTFGTLVIYELVALDLTTCEIK